MVRMRNVDHDAVSALMPYVKAAETARQETPSHR